MGYLVLPWTFSQLSCEIVVFRLSTIVFSFPFSGTRPGVSNFSSRISRQKVHSRKYVLGLRENRYIKSLSVLSVCLSFVRLSICSSIYLSFVCLSVHLFVFLFFFFLSFSFSRLEFIFLMKIFLVPEV